MIYIYLSIFTIIAPCFRHNILLVCKIDNLLLPLKRGSMDDIEEDVTEASETTLDYSSSHHTEVSFVHIGLIILSYINNYTT